MSRDDVGPREVEVLVAALELRPAEVGRGEVPGLDHGAHGAVEDQDAARSSWSPRSTERSGMAMASILAHARGWLAHAAAAARPGGGSAALLAGRGGPPRPAGARGSSPRGKIWVFWTFWVPVVGRLSTKSTQPGALK